MGKQSLKEQLDEHEVYVVAGIIASYMVNRDDPNIVPLVDELVSVIKMVHGEMIHNRLEERKQAILESERKRKEKSMTNKRWRNWCIRFSDFYMGRSK